MSATNPAAHGVGCDALFGDSERNWTEDLKYENGNYGHVCRDCGKAFIGDKHRLPQCRKCSAVAKAKWDAMTPEQQLADKNAALALARGSAYVSLTPRVDAVMNAPPENAQKEMDRIYALARELEMHMAAVRHSRDYWADREAALRRAIVEYVSASMVNVPADRVQKAWDKLRYIADEYSPDSLSSPNNVLGATE